MREIRQSGSEGGGNEQTVSPYPYLFCYLVTLPLAHKDAAGVGCIAAVEREQQIQSWEAKDINLWAATWACSGENV